MTPTLRKTAELAMIRAIPDLIVGEVKPGRLKNIMEKLRVEVDGALVKLPMVDRAGMVAIEGKILQFEKAVRWNGKNRHVATLALFCQSMIEESDFDFPAKIVELLVELVDYFDRAGKASDASFWAGGLAAEKWRAVMEA